MPITATEAVVPRPVIRMMTGAIATSGTLRSSRASGITPASTVLRQREHQRQHDAIAMPTTKPMAASLSEVGCRRKSSSAMLGRGGVGHPPR